MLEIITFVLGPLENNVYLLAEPGSKQAVVIDPGYDSHRLIPELVNRGLSLEAVWITHAHFDHFAGLARMLREYGSQVPVGLHPADLPQWRSRGGADHFGARLDAMPEPDLEILPGQGLFVGTEPLEVRYAPGHSAGHVMFYSASARALLCGDVIFYGSIGRTDLPGGSYQVLIDSIKNQVLSLPDETRLLPGHGPESTVGDERTGNPFLQDDVLE